jgi:F-type H+-transporting ATPase subunit epsilon
MSNETRLIDVSIVSAEEHLYTGKAVLVTASGVLGELGIPYGHAQLLTELKPGQVRLVQADGSEEVFYVSGGYLEVQPDVVTILADVAMRAADLDEAKAEEALRVARSHMGQQVEEQEYATALAEIANASAQLQAIRLLRRRIV